MKKNAKKIFIKISICHEIVKFSNFHPRVEKESRDKKLFNSYAVVERYFPDCRKRAVSKIKLRPMTSRRFNTFNYKNFILKGDFIAEII